jgi:putative oxidoreductase
MKIALWIVQILLALVFIASGSMKLFAFDQFAASAPALADQRGLVTFIGIAEFAGAIGLILPRWTGILPVLTTWAAVGLATIMVLATGFHLTRGEFSHAAVTVILLALAAFVVYGRGFRQQAA